MHNCIHLVKDEHVESFSENLLASFVYCFLLSDVVVKGNDLISLLELPDIYNKFKYVEEDSLDSAIDFLKEIELLCVEEKHLLIGRVDGRRKLLFTPEVGTTDLTDSYDLILSRLSDWKEETKRPSAKGRIEYLEARVRKLSEKDTSDLVVPDYVDLFSYTYEAFYETQHREFTKTEYGQMKTSLYNLFDAGILVKMLVNYVSNVEVYHKWPPTIASFCHFKDEVYLRIKGASKKEKLRTKNTSSDF